MVCHIAPPNLLAHLIEHGTPQRARPARTRVVRHPPRAAPARRAPLSELDVDVRGLGFLTDAPGGARSVYDVEHGGLEDLPGTLVRGPDDGPVADEAVNEAFDGAGTTYDFYRQIYERDSVDGKGAALAPPCTTGSTTTTRSGTAPR